MGVKVALVVENLMQHKRRVGLARGHFPLIVSILLHGVACKLKHLSKLSQKPQGHVFAEVRTLELPLGIKQLVVVCPIKFFLWQGVAIVIRSMKGDHAVGAFLLKILHPSEPEKQSKLAKVGVPRESKPSLSLELQKWCMKK